MNRTINFIVEILMCLWYCGPLRGMDLDEFDEMMEKKK